MRKLTASTFLTLDGVMQAPGGPEEDPSSGFEYGGWSVPFWDEVMMQTMTEWMDNTRFDLLLGRKTYEIFAAHWPFSEEPGADVLNAARKYVASTTLDKVEWNNSVLLEGDLPAAVTALKEQDGPEIQVHGSSDLLQSLLQHGLVDEFRMMVSPVVVGTGKRLFGDGTVPRALKLTSSTVSTTGVLILTYEIAGPLEPGTFAMEEPTDLEKERRGQLAED